MSKSKFTRRCAFGLRIVSPDGEEWHWFATFEVLARDLTLRLHSSTHRLDGSNKGPRVPFTVADADGLCMTWLRETPYQGEHTHYGATWRIRTEWRTYEAFGRNGRPLQIDKVLNSFDLEGHLAWRKTKRGIAHGDRGHGPVPGIHKARGGSGWLRSIQTTQENRLNALVLPDEGEIAVRAARNQKNLPTAWDDFLRNPQRSWKAQRKGRRQWARHAS